MDLEWTKSEKRCVRELAGLAWERQLRKELLAIGDAIDEMRNNSTSPHEVAELIHQFHNGSARDLYHRYSGAHAWVAVCRAHYDGILTDDDVADTSERIREAIRRFAETVRTIQ